MTLDNAIKHCEEKAKTAECKRCREEHEQLSHWLVELKNRRKSQPMVHAKWEETDVETGSTVVVKEEFYSRCSNCGYFTAEPSKYCPNCGLKMF